MVNRSVDFYYEFRHAVAGTMRARAYITGGALYRITDIWHDVSRAHYSFEYKKGRFIPRPAWAGIYDECPDWLAAYVNTSEFRAVANAEMRKIAKRFEKAARPDAAQEGGAEHE